MTRSGAERAITVSALIVVGIYTYRRLTEGSSPAPVSGSKLKQLAGEGTPPSVGPFITAWGLTFLVISIIASFAPGLGGAFAILVATADALGNTTQVAADVNAKIGAPGTAGATQAGKTAAGTAEQATSGATAAGTGAVQGIRQVTG